MTTTQLKNGQTTEDPRLDRIPSFDPRSRSFPVRNALELLAEQGAIDLKRPRSFTWSLRPEQVLDQGSEGSCVGHGWVHELLAKPSVASLRDASDLARNVIYREAQKIDEWPGEAYEGTSVLAGAKVVQRLGGMKEYRWAFGLDDVLRSIGHLGPVVLGLNWYRGMINTDRDGFIRPTGGIVGGHCITAIGVSHREKRVKLVNSWGRSWGIDGFCFLAFEHLGQLLSEHGEACVPLLRQKLVA